jgi:hypothetical protein
MDTSFFRENVDVVVIDRPLQQYKIWEQLTTPKPYSFAVASAEILKFWDNKLAFKEWMIKNGFGAHILRPLDHLNPSFPCILKVVDRNIGKADHVTSGKAVFLIKNSSQLKEVITTTITKHNKININKINKGKIQKKEYFLEEALPGVFEGTFYAAAFEGKLVSLRCMVGRLLLLLILLLQLLL